MEANLNANEISQGINRLKNRIDEALNRSQSATLNSHRSLSSALDAAPQEASRTAAPCTNETDLYRSIQNYQVKTVNGFEPSYFPVQNHYHGFVPAQTYVHPHVQPLMIPFGHQYPVQEVRSATYGYESYALSSPTHFYQPLEYVDDYEGRLSQRNQSSGKKKSTRARKEELQNDQDSFSKDSKDTKKTQPQAQQNQPNNAAPQNQQQNQPSQQNQQSNATKNNQVSGQSQQPQPPQQNQQNNNGQAQQNQKPAVDKNNLVMLPKKPFLIDTYNFGQENRRGGSQRI